jgi:predicted lipid-binding transport protein (Tim44 family)
MGLTSKKNALIVLSVALTSIVAAADTSSGAGAGIAGLFVLAAIVGLYFLPTIVAALRHHHNTAMIAILNFFLGWTFIGWVIFLAMAFGNPSPQQTIIHNVYSGPAPAPALAPTSPEPMPINTTPTV